MVAPVATYTLADVIAYTQRQFGDESGVQITTADITRWCNQGQTEIVSKNPFLEKTGVTVFATAPNNGVFPPNLSLTNFPVPSDCIKIDHITVVKIDVATFANTAHIPTYVNYQEFFNQLGDSQLGSAVTPTGFTKPKWWTEYGNNITIYPYISLTDAYIVELAVAYRCLPNKVSVLSDILGIPDVYFDRLCEYIMSQAYVLDQDLASAGQMRQQFESKLTEVTNRETDISGTFQVISEYGWD